MLDLNLAIMSTVILFIVFCVVIAYLSEYEWSKETAYDFIAALIASILAWIFIYLIMFALKCLMLL